MEFAGNLGKAVDDDASNQPYSEPNRPILLFG